MSDHIQDYLRYLRDVRKLSEKSIISYGNDLKLFEAYSDDKGILMMDMSYEQARRFVAELSRSGYKKSSINRTLSALKGFYSYCIRYDVCSINPFSRIKSFGGGRRLPVVLTRDEIQTLFNAPGNDFTGTRDRVIFELLYSTGCRLSELIQMNREDIQLNEEVIKVMGKGGKERYLFLTESAKKVTDLYLGMVKRKVFPSDKVSGEDKGALLVNTRGQRLTPQGVHHIFRKYLNKLGITKHITPHTFRHTFATHLMENDAGIRVVQELLGHENISTTQIYSHVSAERLKEVYRKSHPHGNQ